MKTIPFKLPHIIIPIHKRKPPLPTFNILLIPTRIHIPRKVPIHALAMFEPAKEFPLIHIAIGVVVGAMALHKVVDEGALVHRAVGEFV